MRHHAGSFHTEDIKMNYMANIWMCWNLSPQTQIVGNLG